MMSEPVDIPQLLSVATVASRLDCQPKHVRRLCRAGQLRWTKPASATAGEVTQQARVLIFADSLREYLGLPASGGEASPHVSPRQKRQAAAELAALCSERP